MIELMKKFSLTLSRKSLLAIYKSFVRPNLGYADIIYDKPLNGNWFFWRGYLVIKYIKSLVWNLWQIEYGLKNLSLSQNNLRITTILP